MPAHSAEMEIHLPQESTPPTDRAHSPSDVTIKSNFSTDNLLRHNEEPVKSALSVWRKILFGMAAPPLQMSANVVGFFFGIFLLEVVHLDPFHVSIILFAGRAFDAITDPIAGQLVSKTKTRFGRSRPWMIISNPLGAASFYLLWNTFDGILDTDGKKLAYYMFMYLAYCTFITGYHVPYASSTMVIANNAVDKDGATAFRMAFELAGTIIGVGLFGMIINTKRIASSCSTLLVNVSNETKPTISPDRIYEEKTTYLIGAAIITAIYVACGIIGFFGIQEKYPVPETASSKSTFWQNIKGVLTFKPYLLLMSAFLFISLGVQIVQVNLALYSTHSVHLGKYMSSGIITVLTVAILFIPLWYRMTLIFGKKRIYMVGIMIEIPCLLVAMLAPNGNVYVYFGIAGVSGVAISVAMLLPWSMLPDVIDDYYFKHGVRREATFYSLYVFFNKFAVGFSIAASQIVLQISSYDSNSCNQPASVGQAIRYLIGPAPIACFILGLICLKLYPITRSYRETLTHNLFDMEANNEKCKNNSNFVSSDKDITS